MHTLGVVGSFFLLCKHEKLVVDPLNNLWFYDATCLNCASDIFCWELDHFQEERKVSPLSPSSFPSPNRCLSPRYGAVLAIKSKKNLVNFDQWWTYLVNLILRNTKIRLFQSYGVPIKFRFFHRLLDLFSWDWNPNIISSRYGICLCTIPKR